jgi:hypothetical protein
VPKNEAPDKWPAQLAEHLAGARIVPLTAEREPPAWRPVIRAGQRRTTPTPCQECGGNAKGAAELEHLQRAAVEGFPKQLLIRSRLALCPACAAAARRRGWAVLPRAWAVLATAPGIVVDGIAAPTMGAMQ